MLIQGEVGEASGIVELLGVVPYSSSAPARNVRHSKELQA